MIFIPNQFVFKISMETTSKAPILNGDDVQFMQKLHSASVNLILILKTANLSQTPCCI